MEDELNSLQVSSKPSPVEMNSRGSFVEVRKESRSGKVSLEGGQLYVSEMGYVKKSCWIPGVWQIPRFRRVVWLRIVCARRSWTVEGYDSLVFLSFRALAAMRVKKILGSSVRR